MVEHDHTYIDLHREADKADKADELTGSDQTSVLVQFHWFNFNRFHCNCSGTVNYGPCLQASAIYDADFMKRPRPSFVIIAHCGRLCVHHIMNPQLAACKHCMSAC